MKNLNIKSKKFSKQGYLYLPNKNFNSELKKIKKIVAEEYSKKDNYYLNLKVKDFYKKNVMILNNIYKNVDINSLKKKAVDLLKKKAGILEEFYTTSYISLLISRPYGKNKIIHKDHEFVDWHRETFYSDAKIIENQINIWIPIFNVKKLQNFQYIPGSQNIPDNKIKLYKEKNKFVKKNSLAHRCGINYAPKRIVGGIDFKKKKRFNVPNNNFLAFNSNLIHGAGSNLCNNIRFAFSFGIIPKKIFKKTKIKKHFRSNQKMYIPLEKNK